EGFDTLFNYDFPTTKFMYTTKNLSNSQAYTTLVWLKDIWSPRLKSTYDWDGPIVRNLGADGAFEGYRVKSRYDQERRYDPNTGQSSVTGDLNHINYQYSGDYTGYPTYTMEESIPESYNFSSEATIASTGLKTKSLYNGKKQLLSVENTASNGEKKIKTYLSFDANFKLKPTRTEIADYSSSGAVNKLYVDQTYNDWGGISSITKPLTIEQVNDSSVKPLYTTTYSYEPTFKFITEKKWYQNASTLLTATNAYDNLGRLITTTNAKGESTQYTYTKPTEGEVVTKTKTLEGGKTAKTILTYGPEAKFAFPTVAKSYYTDQNGSTKETKTTKTYDLLFGLTQSETDNSGNTTNYSYDNVGRVTSIKMPNYATVDSYNYEVEKNSNIVWLLHPCLIPRIRIYYPQVLLLIPLIKM
ncbi:MAG TPA: hypothetical protein VJ824_05480, partial [Bacillota bacterium]|nr:hypothetical protein [Bacillota bacterium]